MAPNRHDIADDVLTSVALLLNVAGVVALALWLGRSASAAGISAIVLFAASFICFAVDRPEESEPTAAANAATQL